MVTLTEEAEALRLGLMTGLLDAQAVVAWADRVILDDRVAEAPVVLDLTVSGTKGIADLVTLLRTVPGDAASGLRAPRAWLMRFAQIA
jgi:hypothetical protein